MPAICLSPLPYHECGYSRHQPCGSLRVTGTSLHPHYPPLVSMTYRMPSAMVGIPVSDVKPQLGEYMQPPPPIGRLTGVQASHVQHAPAMCSYSEAHPSSDSCPHETSPQPPHSAGASPSLLPLVLALPRVSHAKRKASSTMVVERHTPRDGDAAMPLLSPCGKTAVVTGRQSAHRHGRGRCPGRSRRIGPFSVQLQSQGHLPCPGDYRKVRRRSIPPSQQTSRWLKNNSDNSTSRRKSRPVHLQPGGAGLW